MSIRMKRITVKDYRCFGGSQSVRLAPITLLVGENSSGKTTLLAMIRALWDSTFTPFPGAPDFKEHPFNLGSFEEMLHRGSRAQRFEAGFDFEDSSNEEIAPYKVEVDFVPQWGPPVIGRRRISNGGCWIEQRAEEDGYTVRCGTPNGSWSRHQIIGYEQNSSASNEEEIVIPPISYDLMLIRSIYQQKREPLLSLFSPIKSSP